MRMRPPAGFAENQESSNELENAIYKLRLIGFKDEAALLENSAHCRDLLEFLAPQLKAHISCTEPIPDHLAELSRRFAQGVNEREKEPGEA
jgi:hypothetical protein